MKLDKTILKKMRVGSTTNYEFKCPICGQKKLFTWLQLNQLSMIHGQNDRVIFIVDCERCNNKIKGWVNTNAGR